jgi:uncharacterized protein YdeI (YjbR/CyaY-like superfamily)
MNKINIKNICINTFINQKLFNYWLKNNYNKCCVIWIKIYKKKSNIQSITYYEALEEAISFGWIDSQKKSYDDFSYIQRFTPRKNKSNWSIRNIKIANKLINENRMHPSGLKAINNAKKNGQWKNII